MPMGGIPDDHEDVLRARRHATRLLRVAAPTTAHSVREFTVGELYEAVRSSKGKRSKSLEAATPE